MEDERDTTDQPLPGSVSNQNGEEAQPGQDGGAGGEGKRDSEADRTPAGSDAHPSGGDAGEGSQSTGNPHSAG